MADGINLLALLKSIAPDATEGELHSFLWCCSPYPFTNIEDIEKSLRETLAKGGGTVGGAINYAYEELDRCMAEVNRREQQLESR